MDPDAAPGTPEYLGDWRTAEHTSGYTKLYFSYEGLSSQCFIVKAVDSGMMICVPQGGITTSVLEQAAETGYEGVLGPWKLISVAAVSSSGGRELKKTVACLLIDLAVGGLDLLSAEPKAELQQVTFGTVRLQSVWPSGVRVLQALEEFVNGEEVEAFERLEPYITADDGAADPGVPPGFDLPGVGAGAADSSDVLQQLLQTTSSNATLLSGLQSRLQSLDQVERRLAQLESRPSAPAAAPPTSAGPAWAPQLFTEGESAQLTPGQVQQLLTLAGRAPRTLGDLPGPSVPLGRNGGALRLGATAKASAAPALRLGAVQEVNNTGDGEEADGAEGVEGEGVLQKLLVQQTAILAQLAASTRKSSDPLHQLLSSTGGADEDLKLPGVKGMAARQLVREHFQRSPTLVYNKVKERLAQARRKPGVGDLEPRDMYLHFQETVPLGSFKTLTYVSFLLCTAWEAMENGRGDEVASIIARGLVFCEQVANEAGHTRLAWLLTCLDDPPFALVESRRAPRAEVPHGMLSDPRWIAAQLGYLRDAQLIQERTSAVHGQQTTAPPNTPDGPKGRGKRGKGAQVSMTRRLEGMVSTFVRLGRGLKGELERSVQKFETLSEQLAVMQKFCLELSSQLQPYKGCAKKPAAQAGDFDSECQLVSKSAALPRVTGARTSYKPLDPDRLVFEQAPTFKVFIPQGKNLVISSDDLKDFYHAFAVSDEHASRNHLHGVFPGSAFQGWHAYRFATNILYHAAQALTYFVSTTMSIYFWLMLGKDVAAYGVLATAEEPLGSVVFQLDIFQRLLERGFFTLVFSCCSYGTPFQRPTRLLANNPALRVLASGCACPFRGKHLRLESTFDRKSLQKFVSLCRPDCMTVFGRNPQIGEALSEFSGSCPLIVMQRLIELQLPAMQTLGNDDREVRRPAYVPPRWIGDLGRCMAWKTLIQYRFKRINHININEELAYRSLLKYASKAAPSSRFGVLLDSRVTIGCNSKGRSSSASLNFFISTSLPYILGGDLYPCLFHIGTDDNCADDPSRLRPLRAAAAELPVWLQGFLDGDHRFLTVVRAADDFSGALGRWTRLTLLLFLLQVVASRRELLFLEFTRWVEGELQCSFQQVASSGLLLGTALVGYGKALFYSGSPKYTFSETLNAVVDRFKHFRASLGAAWSILTRWEEEEPVERSMVMPEAVFRAAIAVALLWQWPLFAAALLVGFHGLLRPGEILSLRRRDLLLPRDLLSCTPVAYVTILGAKTRRFLQRQHAKVSDFCSVKFLDALFGHLPGIVPLFACSPAVFRKRWNLLFGSLGVPTAEDAKGITPKSLRGSGATWMYQLTEDVERIQWRGRWQQRRTLEHYLQEVAGQLLLADLTESHRARILHLAAFAAPLLQMFTASLMSSTPAAGEERFGVG
ncbi:SUF4 [Symbiodinium sp. CCMP2456]|nr:SUF4 [Symbiodinium sp. CCMP2456]